MFRRKRRAEDFAEEIKAHLDLEAEDLKHEGLSVDEARRQARAEFGSVQTAQERFYLKNRIGWFENLLRDLRYGLRGLWHNPGFTAVAVITLGLAIGANASIFSLFDQALLRTLPVKDPGQLVVLSFAGDTDGHTHSYGGNPPGHRHEFSYPMYRDLREKNTVFSGLIAAAPSQAGLTWNNHAESVSAEMVSGNYFETLGVRPAEGRLFDANDETAEGANPVAVLSFDYWKTHLDEAPVVGHAVLVNGTTFTITGVAAPGFHSMVWGRTPDVFVPITMQRVVEPEWTYLKDHDSYFIDLMGRLRPGVTRVQAQSALNLLFLSLRRSEFALLHDQSANARKGYIDEAHLNLEPGGGGFSPMRGDVRTPLLIMMGMVLLVVSMAIVNVASLLLVRAASRVREFSIRYSLGATGGQILRQLLAEGALLGVAGAAIGLLLAPRALQLLIHWMHGSSPDEPVFSSTLDWHVLLFTIAATFIASLLFSLAPAVQFWNPRLADALKQNTGTGIGGSLKFRRTCVALQVGFSLLLIVGAGLFVRTIQNLRNVNAGFATDHLLSFDLSPAMAGYPLPDVAPVEQRVLDAIAVLPGVRGAGATNDADLAGDNRTGDVKVSGYTPKPNEDFDVELPWVSDNYLQTLGVPLAAGRYFAPSDTATSTRVAIVNQSFAQHFFGSVGAALGQHVSRPGRPETDATIVGVVRDVKHTTVRDPAMPTCYVLFVQSAKVGGLKYYVRTWQSPDSAVNSIRAAVAQIDPKLVVGEVSTMTDAIDDSILEERTIALLATVFGVLATILAGIGLYGILAYSTTQRTREIGIRMALGAHRGTVIGMIVRDVMVLAGAAVGVTIPLAIVGSRLVRSELFGISFADPAVYGMGILVIGAVAALASLIPAQRSASVNPVDALRAE
ncbi:MAG TPA: ABC transporter permease [Terracidiphilus sp.]|nr:ABC transporter permease [Terracidiphilus sp.]